MDNKTVEKTKLLLHSCCGPCSTAVIERLLSEDKYEICVYYSNSNITDEEEYNHRKSEQIRVINTLYPNVKFVEGCYNPEAYLKAVKGLESEPEGGKRCAVCFALRLDESAGYAKENGFDCFDTTLTVSPYKDYNIISEIGSKISEKYGIEYLSGNYKKKDGFKRSTELSKQLDLYRQHFCGCEFSKRPEEEE